jgi:hypothetical protein
MKSLQSVATREAIAHEARARADCSSQSHAARSRLSDHSVGSQGRYRQWAFRRECVERWPAVGSPLRVRIAIAVSLIDSTWSDMCPRCIRTGRLRLMPAKNRRRTTRRPRHRSVADVQVGREHTKSRRRRLRHGPSGRRPPPESDDSLWRHGIPWSRSYLWE